MTLQSGLCRGKPFDTKDITRVNKTIGHRKMHNPIQLNKPKQLNTINTTS